ncbi:MAG: sugar ABC transporter permease, partial [Chloroflexota bacterium]
MATSAKSSKQKNSSSIADFFTWKKIKAALEGYAYIAPTLIVLTIFVFIPIISSFQISLTRVAPFGNATRYVGMENYTNLLTDARYHRVMWTTFWFTVGTVPTGIAISVFLGILLSYPLKYMSWFYRLLIFVPIVMSSAVTGVLFRWIFHPVVGYLNYALTWIGVDG